MAEWWEYMNGGGGQQQDWLASLMQQQAAQPKPAPKPAAPKPQQGGSSWWQSPSANTQQNQSYQQWLDRYKSQQQPAPQHGSMWGANAGPTYEKPAYVGPQFNVMGPGTMGSMSNYAGMPTMWQFNVAGPGTMASAYPFGGNIGQTMQQQQAGQRSQPKPQAQQPKNNVTMDRDAWNNHVKNYGFGLGPVGLGHFNNFYTGGQHIPGQSIGGMSPVLPQLPEFQAPAFSPPNFSGGGGGYGGYGGYPSFGGGGGTYKKTANWVANLISWRV